MKRMIEKTAAELELLAVPALRRCLKQLGHQGYIDELAKINWLLSKRSMEETDTAIRNWHAAKDHHDNLESRDRLTKRGYVAPDWTPPTEAEVDLALRNEQVAYNAMQRSWEESGRAQSLALDTWEILVEEWQRRKRTKSYPHASEDARKRFDEEIAAQEEEERAILEKRAARQTAT